MPYNGLHCTGGCVVCFLTSEERKRNADGGVLAGCRLRLAAEQTSAALRFLELTGAAETPSGVETPSICVVTSRSNSQPESLILAQSERWRQA